MLNIPFYLYEQTWLDYHQFSNEGNFLGPSNRLKIASQRRSFA
ncbi:hypothetical protein QWZ13_13985 [Reinekea marina]|nr:hypothetical protein [Reinekea marina]MDN3650026.1 hypothetical protein [Reinekea marina]